MCPENRNECVLTIETKKPFETHGQIAGNSWVIYSMVSPIFYGAIVILSGDVMNPIFLITLMIFGNG